MDGQRQRDVRITSIKLTWGDELDTSDFVSWERQDKGVETSERLSMSEQNRDKERIEE